jgi:hypothetical protein
MSHQFTKHPVALAAIAAITTAVMATATSTAMAQPAVTGKYVAGDFHNHSTCSDGSLSLQKKVKKSTQTWGLDWFVQAGHGGSGSRNCTLTEDASLATPGYPFTNQGPSTTWANSGVTPLGNPPGANMWRWQQLQSFAYPLLENLASNKNLPLFLGLESVVEGHEHTSMAVITGQMPAAIYTTPISGPSTVLGNANAQAEWTYCFDRGNGADVSRGVTNQWTCDVPGSTISSPATPFWSSTGQKLIPSLVAGSAGLGERGHIKTLEAVRWMQAKHPNGSYYVPAHLERAGPFNPNGNNGFNVEHLRNFNNAGPTVAFGFETQPGHGASSDRGEYLPRRQTINGVVTDSVGGTTYGGTGVYGAVIGGVWDALLGEGRNFWFFASSDWHNRGIFGPDDTRTTQDFEPGEYQKNYTLVKNGVDRLNPQNIVDGLRSGNTFTDSGQLIDRLAFVACTGLSAAQVQALAVAAANDSTAPSAPGCATMGERLTVAQGTNVVIAIVARDPQGTSNSPYIFPNPSLLQVGINQPLNKPVLDHIDLIGGLVTGLKSPGAPDYAGQWPANTDWLRLDGTTATINDVYQAPDPRAGQPVVPPAAKNTTAGIRAVFNSGNWTPVVVSGAPAVAMTYTATVNQSQYFRLRGTNLPASVPFETDASGNPLSDLYTNSSDESKLRIPCTTVGNNVPPVGGRKPYTGNDIDGCPTHLPVVGGVKYSALDVAAWADIWFYSNPIYVQVNATRANRAPRVAQGR